MMDQVDLDASQARVDLLPDKYDRRRISQILAIRRLSSRHNKRPMSEGNVCSEWMLLLVLVWSLHHIHSKYWPSFKRRHSLLVCFISLLVAVCWNSIKILWKELDQLLDMLYDCRMFISLLVASCWKAGKEHWKDLMQSDAVCDAAVMLGLYWEIIYELWLFLERHCLTTEIHIMYIEPDEPIPRRVVGSKVDKEPVVHVVYEMVLCYGTGWAWFRSLLIGPSHLVIRQLLIISGDVELNPGPLDDHKTVEQVLMTVDDTIFEVDDWNIVVIECKSLAAKWEELSIYLGLSFEVTDNIKGSGDNHHCWSETLKHWIKQNYNTEKFGLPSWRSLLTAVAKVDKLLFKELAAKHQARHTKPVEASATESSLNESKGAERGTPDTTELGKAPSSTSSPRINLHPTMKRGRSSSRSLGRVFKLFSKTTRKSKRSLKESKGAEGGTPDTTEPVRAPPSPILPTINLNPTVKGRLCEKVSPKSEQMVYKFQKLYTVTRKSLREEKVSVSELVRHLECLGSIKPIYKDAGLSPLRRQLPGLAEMETVDDVMSIVKDYCSFFNYHMLEHIIDEFGTSQDKENLAAYKKDFEEYAQCCVIEGPLEVGKMSEDDVSNMFVTLDDSFDNCTLSHLNIFVADLRKALNISSDVGLRLCYINRGSIKLTFQLPHSVQQDVFPLSPKQEALLADLGVVELSCGLYRFTRQEAKEVEDPCASDEDSDYADSDAELASMAAGLTLRKPGDTFSITDSALGRSSYTGTTAVGTVATEDILDRPDLDDPDMGMGHDSSGHKLRLASQRGDLKEVKRLTEEKQLNPLQEDKDGRNALHYAAWGGQLSVMKYFIEEQGHNPASQSSGIRAGWTPLHYAAQFNDLELVQYLAAEQHVDPMCQAKNGSTPLHKACHGDNIDVVIYLVDAMSKYLPLKDVVSCRGGDGQTPLHTAALCGQLEIVKYFITELNCDPNIVQTGEHHGRTTRGGGRIALHNAAQKGHLHIVKFLIEDQHCDPSHLDYRKATPLHMAASKGHLDTVKYLTLEQHCDPLCTNDKNNIPLHDATMAGHLEVVKFLIETLHCPPDIRGWHNETPLDKAHSRGHYHVVKYLDSLI